MKEFITLAKTDKEGNLRVYKDALNDFCRQNKDCSFVLKLFAIPCERTSPQKAYYYNYIVHLMKNAFWEMGERMTEEQAETTLREIAPVMHVEKVINNAYVSTLKNIEELSNDEFNEYIETIKQIAAEYFNVFIEDPK